MSTVVFPLMHASQALLSSFTGYYTYLSINKTLTYEDSTKKAAKYSNTAEYHLWKTRKTLGGGAVGVLASLLASLSLIIPSTSKPSPDDTYSPAVLSMTSFTLAAYLTFSHSHISNYWRSSPKIPLPKMGDYNDAISTTDVMRTCLACLAVSWAVVGGSYLWMALVG